MEVVLGRKTLGPIPSKLPTFSRLKSKKSNPGEPQVEENCRIWYKGHALDFKVGSLQFVRCPASPTALEYLQFFHKLIEDRSEPKDKNIKWAFTIISEGNFLPKQTKGFCREEIQKPRNDSEYPNNWGKYKTFILPLTSNRMEGKAENLKGYSVALFTVTPTRSCLGPLKSKKSNPGEPQVEENCRIWYKVSKAQGAKG
ncbi:hypothetical protein G9A89_011754 [Geosiphon pyriformis]|nr:hypothetical protein G9A89_011754 [Geosiphon pyriformis]